MQQATNVIFNINTIEEIRDRQDVLEMNRDGQIRMDQLHQLDALLRVHGDHEEWQGGGWDGSSAEVDEHQVDVLVGVALWDGFEVVD